MSLDQTLAVAGSALGAVGVVTTVVARLRADPTPRVMVRVHRTATAVRTLIPAGARPVDAGTTASTVVDPSAAPVDVNATTGPLPVVAEAPPGSSHPPSPKPSMDVVGDPEAEPTRPRRRRFRRDGRSNAELDDELVTSTVLGWFVLWIVTTLALGFADTEVQVLQIVAQIAVAGSLVAAGGVVYDLTRRRARHVGWMIDLFVVTAALAAVPLWFHQPWFGQGRFDHLDDWLPSDGSVDERLNETLKDYGPGIVAHVLVQAAGIAALVAVALYVVATIVRRARGRYGHQPLDRWVSLSALVATLVGAVCASGSVVSVPVRTFASSSFTTAEADAKVGGNAPALALHADRLGRVSLLFARCGDDRILALNVDERVVVSPGDERTSRGLPAGGGVTATRVPGGTGPVTIVFRSSRRYETTVVFPRRPRANRFIPLRTKDTLTTFYKRGHGC